TRFAAARDCASEHSLHAGSADRSLVADDDDVAWHDPAIPHRLEAFGLRIEDSGRPAMQPTLMSGEFHDAAIGRQRSTQDREPTGRLERRLDGDDDPLAVGRDGVRADLGEGPALDRGRTTVAQGGDVL